MNSGDILGQSRSFRDYKAICERSELVFLDNQTRRAQTGFQANGDMGKLIHGLLGWDKLVPESMAMYQSPSPTFRVASRPVPEARMWMVEGFAGTIQPWWHHIGAYHEDRRQYRTAQPLMAWHERYQPYLIDRQPVASVGVVWSQENVDWHGRDAAESRVMRPYWGVVQALIRARIPYLPIHADHIRRAASGLAVLVLPNLGVLSDAQASAVRQFVRVGGGLLASGQVGYLDEVGERRPSPALGDLLGVCTTGDYVGALEPGARAWDAHGLHTYLRLHPQLRVNVDGPHPKGEPEAIGARHPVLEGFAETDLLPFGGRLERVVPGPDTTVPMTFVPPFPIYPPETAWMRESDSGLPALVLREGAALGRTAYLAASLDHAYAQHNLPDHGALLANLLRWLADDRLPLKVNGPGLIDCHLYQQSDRLVLHLVNLSHPGAWRPPLHELLPVGPLEVAVRLPSAVPGQTVRGCVEERELPSEVKDGWCRFTVPSVLDHEMIVVG
jgi:hypothetical protein